MTAVDQRATSHQIPRDSRSTEVPVRAGRRFLANFAGRAERGHFPAAPRVLSLTGRRARRKPAASRHVRRYLLQPAAAVFPMRRLPIALVNRLHEKPHMQILPMTAAAVAARAGAGTGISLFRQAGGFAGRLLEAAGAGLQGEQQSEQADPADAADFMNAGAVTSGRLERQLQAILHSAHSEFVALLDQAGVSPDPPVKLQLDETTGELTIPPDHPHRAQIEAVLAEQPELANRFRQAIALESLLRAARQLPPISPDASEDPEDTARAEAREVSVIIDRQAARMSAVPAHS